METGRFSRLVPMAAPLAGSLSAILIVDPGKIFSNSPGVTFGKTPDGYTCLKRS
jgi:predicted membrane metal-binding protein